MIQLIGVSSMDSDKYSPWLSLLSAVLGLWIIATPFVWSLPETLYWSNIAAGAIIALVAGFGAYRRFQDAPLHLAVPIIVAVLGLWVVVSPFAFADVAQGAVASNVIGGILVLAFSAYVAYLGRELGFASFGDTAI